MPQLRLKGVGRTFPGQVPVVALRDVDITIEQGDYIAIDGPSGSGKSTFLNQLALLDTPTSGTYLIDATETTRLSDSRRSRLRSQLFGFVFQSFYLLAGRSVIDNVAFGALYRHLPEKQRVQAAKEALDFVGLTHREDHKVETLSGGERQRVAIARAIVSGAPIIVADEPTGNLDRASGEAVMDTLERLNQRGATLILVTHDSVLATRAKRRVHVLDGHVTEIPATRLAPASSIDNDISESAQALPNPPVRGRDSTIRFRDALGDAWRGLWAKRSRALALITSVALGVALALATAGLGTTAKYQVSNIFDAAENRKVTASSGEIRSGSPSATQAMASASYQRLSDIAGVENISIWSDFRNVEVAIRPGGAPTELKQIAVVDGHLPADIRIHGSHGPLGKNQLYIGSVAAGKLGLGPIDASPTVWVNGMPFGVAGIITEAGLNTSFLDALIIDSTQVSDLNPPYARVELAVSAGAAQQVGQQVAIAWIPADPESVAVDVPPDPRTLRGEIEDSLNAVLLTLSAVALLTAVLMMTNSMSASVFERTGEFGLRRAIGARRIHIRALVIMESLIVGLIGGIIGAYISVLAILGVTIARSWQPVLDTTLIPIGIAGGVCVGMLGGVIALRRAARIEPSDALHA
ncbi:MAG: ATP-binding cassette domain-containing protein [Actinomycetaceae bacterium]|nr:ATP-binding cassette domain-containing protein [Actinomycetaceae bacterium]